MNPTSRQHPGDRRRNGGDRVVEILPQIFFCQRERGEVRELVGIAESSRARKRAASSSTVNLDRSASVDIPWSDCNKARTLNSSDRCIAKSWCRRARLRAICTPRWWWTNCAAAFPDAEFFGCTGPAAARGGRRTVVDAASLAVVGLVEVVSHIPRIYGEYRKLLARARKNAGPTWRFSPIPRIFTCAWRAASTGRASRWCTWWPRRPGPGARGGCREMRRTLRRLLCIFPFEEEFFRRRRGGRHLYRPPPGRAGAARPDAGRVFSETQAGRGPSISSSAARKPPRRGCAPSARAAGRRGAALPGAGGEFCSAGLGYDRGRAFFRSASAARRSG